MYDCFLIIHPLKHRRINVFSYSVYSVYDKRVNSLYILNVYIYICIYIYIYIYIIYFIYKYKNNYTHYTPTPLKRRHTNVFERCMFSKISYTIIHHHTPQTYTIIHPTPENDYFNPKNNIDKNKIM